MNQSTQWPAFSWEDPFLLEQQLTEEERLIRDTARDDAQEQLAPRTGEAFAQEQTDTSIFREMGELGLLGSAMERYGCFGLTEPDSGSDPGSRSARAKFVDGGYSVAGAKKWISNSPIADFFVVWAKNDEGRICGFILEKGMSGYMRLKLKALTTHGLGSHGAFLVPQKLADIHALILDRAPTGIQDFS
jgi:glutaryl-CoA dehydrogenase